MYRRSLRADRNLPFKPRTGSQFSQIFRTQSNQAASAARRAVVRCGNAHLSADSSCCSIVPLLTQSVSFGAIAMAVP